MVGRGGISGVELMFLSLTGAGMIGIVLAGLELAFRLEW